MGNNNLKWQRKYQKEWYFKNRERIVAKNRIREAKILEDFRKYKEENPCTDCGKKYHYSVMDWDHLYDKKFSIAYLMRQGATKKLEEELKKCELVCSNCHRLRSFKRSKNIPL